MKRSAFALAVFLLLLALARAVDTLPAGLAATYFTGTAWSSIALSYYLAFIDPIGSVYGRFLMPVCLIQAIFGGLAIDRLLNPEIDIYAHGPA